MRAGESEEERRVEFRNLESKWIPVRQKSKPFTTGLKIDSGSNTIRNNWVEVWNPVRGCVTFFFTNFPATCSSNILIGKFREIAVVRDLFIPNRLDKNGKAFGFVRFGGNINISQVERDLNNIWFGPYKLRANISKFARNVAKNDRKVDGGTLTGSNRLGTMGAVREEKKSYLQAICANGGGKINKLSSLEDKDKFVGLSYKSSEEDREFLSRCFSGQLKVEFTWMDIHDAIHEAGEGRFHIKYRGGDLVFIQPYDDQRVDREDLEAISNWFEYLEPWCENDVHNIRVVWTQWFGIPMHAWNKNFFRLISLKFGKMLKIDGNTISKKNVHRARLLINTPLSEIPKGTFPIMIDDHKFFIRIREEADCDEDTFVNWPEGEVLDSDEGYCDWWRSDDEADEADEEQEMVEFAPESRIEKEKVSAESREEQVLTVDCLGIGSETIIADWDSVHDLIVVRDIINEGSTSKDRAALELASCPRILEF
ncbi:hypothetical protein ACS0TY_005457 [Phlomoides rotata]